MNTINRDFFSKNIKYLLDEKNISQKDLSNLINKGEATVSGWINGKFTPKLKTLEDISRVLNIELSELLSEDMAKNKDSNRKTLPILGEIAAGTPILAEGNIEGYFEIDNSVDADFCLRIKGDSMVEKGIIDGDIVFIKEQQNIENGEIGAVLVQDELTGQTIATLKKIKVLNNNIYLIPCNRNLSTTTYPIDKVKIAGKLVGVYRNY